MQWQDLPEHERAEVLALLEREAERVEQEAFDVQTAAQRLGRPSLPARHDRAARALRAAIDRLRATVS